MRIGEIERIIEIEPAEEPVPVPVPAEPAGPVAPAEPAEPEPQVPDPARR